MDNIKIKLELKNIQLFFEDFITKDNDDFLTLNEEKLEVGLTRCELNKEITQLETLSQSTGQPKELFYGVVASRGDANIYDPNGKVAEMIVNGAIPNSNMPIQITANGKQVSKQITTDSDYDNTLQTFSMQFTDKLSQWDSLQYGGYALPTNENGIPQSRKAYQVLSSVLLSVGYTQEQIDNMLDTQIVYGDNNIVGTVKQYLDSIDIPVPYLESGGLREVVDRFCLLAQLQVMQNDNDDIKFVQARPIRVGNEPIIVIPPRNQFSALKKDVVIKNKYDGVELSAKKVENNVEFDSNVSIIKLNKNDIIFESQDGNQQGKIRSAVIVETSRFVYNTAYTKISDIKYGNFNIKIPKFSNLSTILKVKDIPSTNNNDNIRLSLTYTKKVGRAVVWSTAEVNLDSKEYDLYHIDEPKLTQKDVKIVNEDFVYEPLSVSLTVKNPDSSLSGTTSSINITNLSNLRTQNISFNESNQEYEINFKILLEKQIIKALDYGYKYGLNEDYKRIQLNGEITNANDTNNENWTGYVKYELEKIEIYFYGDKRVISFEDLQQSYGSGNNVVSLQGSTLTQSYDGQKPYSQIPSNILTDYADGIETATVTVSCSDYFDTNGIQRKTWSKGDIFQVGDIISLDKDNYGNSAFKYANGSPKLWKVTGRKFRHGGCPYADLELQEVKTIS